MNKKPLLAKFGEIQKFNSQFSKCNVSIAYAGDNRNYSSISKDTFEKMIPSLYGVPVVGEWKEQEEDFGGHGGKVEISDEGIKWIETTKPFGFIDSQAKVWWEEVTEESGKVNEYLMTECFLWTGRYPEALKVLEGNSNQSMEILVKDGEYRDDGYFDVSDAEFSALCILGEEVEPAFESAGFKQFNYDEDVFKSEFNLMIKELKKSFSAGGESVKGENNIFEPVEEEVVATEEFTEETTATDESTATEEVETVETAEEFTEEEVEETGEVEEDFSDSEQVDEEVEESTEEEFETDESVEDEETPAEEEVAEEFVKITKEFQLSHEDVRSKIYNLLWDVEESDGTWYYIQAVYDDYFIYGNDEVFYRQGYVKTDVDLALDGERTKLFVEFLTEDELNAVKDMRNDFESMNEELTTLRAFKEETLKAQKNAEIDELFERYSALLEMSEVADLKENATEMDIEAIEKELSYRVVQKKFDFSKITKKDSTKITINGTSKGQEPYGSASVYFRK